MDRRTELFNRLMDAGILLDDAYQLRRISMTLHRWHELECGDSNNFASWCIVRGRKTREVLAGGSVRHGFEYAEGNETGKPFIERHIHTENGPRYESIADREAGALRRLARIMARYPTLKSYIQGDPRGCALYILRPGDVRDGLTPDACYTNGIAVYK